MGSSKLRKRIMRSLLVSWREQPTRYDIEALQDNIRRVGLVVAMRWVLVLVLVVYSAIAGSFYATRMAPGELAGLMVIPAGALAFVVIYNTFYQLNYRRLGAISVWNNLQLALDAVVVTVLVHYSGGVSSWFWSMYSLFILEAAFILKRRSSTWLQAAWCALLLGGVEWLEFGRILPHVTIPFAAEGLHTDAVYIGIRYMWQVAVLAGTAAVSTRLVATLGDGSREGAPQLLDEATGLYSRAYFLRALPAEVRRAQRDGRVLHVMLIDVDRFGDYNRRFGIDRGDVLLRGMAKAITDTVQQAGDLATTLNTVSRFGGEEFAVLFAEDMSSAGGIPSADDAVVMAEQIRVACEAVRVDDAGVSVSIAVASLPEVGTTADALLDAADDALSRAIGQGGDKVVIATAHAPSSAPTPQA